jgi:hypothetical protein
VKKRFLDRLAGLDGGDQVVGQRFDVRPRSHDTPFRYSFGSVRDHFRHGGKREVKRDITIQTWL